MANAQVTAVSQTALKFFSGGNHPSAHRQLQRLERPDHSGVDPLRDALRAAALRPYEQLSSRRPSHGSRRADALPLWRQAAPGDDRPRPAAPLCARPLPERRQQCPAGSRTSSSPPAPPRSGTRSFSSVSTVRSDSVRDVATLPVKSVNGSTVTIGDVAQVRDGYAPQTSLVRANGRRGVLMTLLKSAGSSTLDIVGPRQSAIMPSLLATLPPEVQDGPAVRSVASSCAPPSRG